MASTKNKRKILVIEDDLAISRVIEFRLEQEGYQIETAKNGEEGLEKVIQAKPDLVLLDIILPKLNGFEVLRKMKEREDTAKIDVIVFSNLSQKDDVRRAMEFGALDFFVKSDLSTDGLAKMVAKYFSQK